MNVNGLEYTQKPGTGIGSSVATVLSLYTLDEKIILTLSPLREGATFAGHYVDDFIVSSTYASSALFLKIFIVSSTSELVLSCSYPQNDVPEFLDLTLRLDGGPCWCNSKQVNKPLLQAPCFHAAVVKRALVFSLLKSAPSRPCAHFVGLSVSRQLKCFKSSGYPSSALASALLELASK